MIFIYRYLVAPVAVFVFYLFVLPFSKKARQLSNLRRQARRKRPKIKTHRGWWVHVSSGEFEYAKAVLRELRKNDPEIKFVVTYSSPSYAKQIEKSELVDHCEPIPFDLPGPLNGFLQFFQPERLLIARTDLCPEMLYQSRKHGLHIAIFALNFSRHLTPIQKKLKAWLLGYFDQLFVVAQSDKDFAENALLLKQGAIVSGDPRFDQARFRISESSDVGQRLKGTPPVLIAGSTWPEDERVLIDGLSPLVKNGRLRLCLVPHEPSESHLANLQQQIKAKSITMQLYSSDARDPFEVLIVDRTGILAQLYPAADLAFVGGSFKRKVHSVLEALVAGLPVFVGPFHENHPEAVKFKAPPHIAPVTVVNNADELRAAVENKLTQDLDNERIRILKLIEPEFGASLKIARLLLQATQKTTKQKQEAL